MTTETPIRWKELGARERDALVAVHLFGWEWMGRDNVESDRIVFRRAIYGPPPYVRFNYSDKIYRPATGSDPLFSDWDNCCGIRGPSGNMVQIGMPKYSTNVSAAFQVVEKMREKGFEVVIHGGSPLDTHPDFIWDVTIQYPTDPFDAGSASTETLPEACCLAALTAIGLTIERE